MQLFLVQVLQKKIFSITFINGKNWRFVLTIGCSIYYIIRYPCRGVSG